MKKELIHDPMFLGIKSKPATKEDSATAQDLLDTLMFHRETCVGMAANMIGKSVCIIAFNDCGKYTVMYNPAIISKSMPYETEEGCLSLSGVRKTTRYQNIEIEYYDSSWKKHRQAFSGWTAQIIQHECDHLEGRII